MFFNKRSKVNRKDQKPIMVQCRTQVNRDAVSRTSIDGVEHIIVKSSTLPDNIVMNGGLYPAEEIEKSFEGLELTLAPIEHPISDGQYISANDPRAIHGFHAGAFNVNVRRKDGKVYVDKCINVSEAMKTERGKRLLDRISELENSDSPRPIHTSVGVFVMPEELSEPVTNDQGQEYTWIARDMVFDHDAILLDSVGAAQPHQGVGMAVNKQGDECDVQAFELSQENDQESMSFTDTRQSIMDAFEKSPISIDYIEEIYPDKVIFISDESLFEVPYVMDEQGIATIAGIPLPVERNVAYTPKTNSEGDAMKDLILNALKEAGVESEGLTNEQLLNAYEGLKANQSESDDLGATDESGIAEIVANAVKPLAEQIEGLQAKLNSQQEDEVIKLAELVANSGKYPGLDTESAKLLGVEKLKEMSVHCHQSFGVSPVINSAGADDMFSAPTDLPE